MRKYGAIRVSATSGWAVAVASSARGSVTAPMTRPAVRTAVSQQARVVPLAAAQVEAAQALDRREHREERRSVDQIPVEVGPGS
jgi:hypothetical protein